MRLRKLVKHFEFLSNNRDKITLDDYTRLNEDENRAQLKEILFEIEEYPTDDDLHLKTWVAQPQSVQQWLGFEVEATHFEVDGQVATSLGFRLSDGVDEYWWDGGNWVVNTTDWNTEVEVAGNISNFPAIAKKLQVIVNLKTTNKYVTPYLRDIKVLYSSNIEFKEDLLYRTLIPLLRDNVRPIADYPIELTSDTDTLDLANDFPLETPYNIVGIDSAYNHTDDPNHNTDIYQSYDPGTNVVTLSQVVSAGKVVWLRFYWEPEVAVTTSRDYTEIQKVPSLVLDDVNLVNATEYGPDDYVVNKSTGEAVIVPAPIRGDLEIMANLITDKGVDQTRLADEMKRFFANNPLITSTGLDEEYRLWLLDEYDMRTSANLGDLHTGRLRFSIVGALFYMRDSIDTYAVKEFKSTNDSNLVIRRS